MDLTPPNYSSDPDDELPSGIILQQLQQILDSPEFNATESQRRFLQYVVNKTVDGKPQDIKGYTLATELFGRAEDFDQNTDPIVSIHANKLRRALERYYLIAGQQDPIRIDIPIGTYVPVFIPQTETKGSATPITKSPAISIKDFWPSLLILPFKNHTGDPEKDFLGFGFASELAVEFTRFDEMKVLFPQEGQIANPSAQFVLDGNIYEDGTGLKITAHLAENKTGKQIWADIHRSNFDPVKLFAFQEKFVQVIASKIIGEYGVIPKVLSTESKKKSPNELGTYEAILRFYEFDQTLTPENFMRAMEALNHAATIEPECGQVWSLLARLYANAYSLDYPGFENPLKKAIEYAEKGVHLNPNNQRAVGTLAFVHFLANELSSALEEVDRAIKLNPNSLLILDGLAYIMILSGGWKRGAALARKVIRLNPYYNPVLHYALWLDCLRQEKYDRAYRETMGLRRPAVFWYPLSKAATLGLLGRYEDGEKFVKKLLELRPDFSTRGRVLIGRYIKFKELVERVIDGLNKVGLEVK